MTQCSNQLMYVMQHFNSSTFCSKLQEYVILFQTPQTLSNIISVQSKQPIRPNSAKRPRAKQRASLFARHLVPIQAVFVSRLTFPPALFFVALFPRKERNANVQGCDLSKTFDSLLWSQSRFRMKTINKWVTLDYTYNCANDLNDSSIVRTNRMRHTCKRLTNDKVAQNRILNLGSVSFNHN